MSFLRAGVPVTLATLTFLLCLSAITGPATAQDDFDNEPINYRDCTPTDAVYRLAQELESGSKTLEWDEQHGWLPALLDELEVPQSSQTLVFSKTSLQIRKISASRPRALYFSDDVYLGWVQNGDFVELAAVDDTQGAMFYKMRQQEASTEIVRDRGECLACHATRRTQSVPGFLVRSVFPAADGQPVFRLGTTTTDHSTPLKDRFGGWYVTGGHGDMRHRGNAVLEAGEETLDVDAMANLTELPRRVNAGRYLRPSSDIVALMVLEHQSQMHNWITKASYRTRQALHQQRSMNRILERDEDYLSESTVRRINSVTEDLLRHLLFCDEAKLTSPITGDQEFAAQFVSRGPKDSDGRSLRDFDLQERMFRYPCSYLIYSPSVRELPTAVLERLHLRLTQVLNGEDASEGFRHLSPDTRSAILTILRQTHWMFR